MEIARRFAGSASRRYRVAFDDAYSDALLGLAEALDRNRDDATLKPYAKRYMWSWILKGIRSRVPGARHKQRPQSVSLEEPIAEDAVVADRIADRSPSPQAVAERQEIAGTIKSLPARQRLIVGLYFDWDLTGWEIARLLGCNQATVSRSLSDVLTKLRPRLAA